MNKEIESKEYFSSILDRCWIHDKDYFTKTSIDMMSDENAEWVIECLQSGKDKVPEWAEKAIIRIKDIKGLI